MKLYIQVFSAAEADYPQWAMIEVVPEFLVHVRQLQSIVKGNNLRRLVVSGSPESWESEDEYCITGDELCVNDRAVWFSGYPKHGDFDIETMAVTPELLEQMLQQSDAPDGTRVGDDIVIQGGVGYMGVDPSEVVQDEGEGE